MIAISEHLRCRGIDPDKHPHTRIPGIWAELDNEYDMARINERDNALEFDDYLEFGKHYKEFSLPEDEFGDRMHGAAINREGSRSPAAFDPEAPLPTKTANNKRKRGASVSAHTRASTVDSSTEPPSSPAGTRSTRQSKRGTSRARKAPSTEPEEEDEESEGDGDGDEEHDEEEEEEENAEETSRGRSSRSARGRGRGRRTGRRNG